jgi:hypothetical protein
MASLVKTLESQFPKLLDDYPYHYRACLGAAQRILEGFRVPDDALSSTTRSAIATAGSAEPAPATTTVMIA